MTTEALHTEPAHGSGNGSGRTHALVLCPDFKTTPVMRGRGHDGVRSPENQLQEAIGLTEAIDISVESGHVIPVARIRPGTLFGSGKAAEIGAEIKDRAIGLVIVAAVLSPVQQRNLEQIWKTKVIDRTGLILEIFGERAQTREGELQVELAHLEYQKSRLVRSWTHLERQRGGLGFVGGPGETQIEADRRMIQERITHIRKQLQTVSGTRELQRKRRQQSRYPVVAMVGYTNAGKSTLFNRLTRSSVMAADMLFATLDPTMRAVDLPSGRRIILSDTVGFISDLPTHLIAAFRATLEEVINADMILHVRDISHPETDHQSSDVQKVLDELNVVSEGHGGPIYVEALNKIDLLDDPEREAEMRRTARDDHVVGVSALSGEGCDRLLEMIDDHLGADDVTRRVHLHAKEGAAIAWLFEHGEVICQRQKNGIIEMDVKMDSPSWGQFESSYQPQEIATIR